MHTHRGTPRQREVVGLRMSVLESVPPPLVVDLYVLVTSLLQRPLLLQHVVDSHGVSRGPG